MRAVVLPVSLLVAACSADGERVLSEKEGADFRADATAHIWRQLDWCPITDEPSLLKLYDPAEQRSEQFMGDITGTELEDQYEQARQEWEQEWGGEQVECADPLGSNGLAKINEDVAEYESLMGRLEDWVKLVEQRSGA